MQTGFRLRGSARSTCAALAALAAMLISAAGAAREVEFDIPAGTLADALDRFGEQSGLQVVYDYALIAERRVAGVSGRMEPGVVLDRFLDGSGVAWDVVNGNTVVLRSANPRAAAAAPGRRRARRPGAEDAVASDLTVVASAHRSLVVGPSAAAFGIDKPLVATPRSVSAVNVSTIDRLGLSAVEDLVRVVPGVYTTTRWGIQGSIDVRNVPADTYFRGMKRLNLQGHGRSVLAAMEAIEVVKGPPSPVFGMGKIGGYTNMVPKSVRAANGGYLTEPEGFVQAVSGSFDKSEVSFGIGGALPLETKQGGYYVYGLFENSGSFAEPVPVEQQVLQAALSAEEIGGRWRLESGFNLQRSRTAGALIGRFTQDLADTGRYIRGTPLVDLDVNGNGRIGYLEMYERSPVRGDLGPQNQALRQHWQWPRTADGRPVPLADFATVPGIPQSLYDYLSAHPAADPDGLLRAQGVGGPLPVSGYVPAGFALDPRTVGYDVLDPRRPAAFEREVEADFVTAYFDLIDDADEDRTVKNQLFVDSMNQHKVSAQPFSQRQDVLVVEDKLTLTRRLRRDPGGLDVNALFSANARYTSSRGRMASGDYANHRADAIAAPGASAGASFATALENDVLEDDGQPWTGIYSTRSWEVGAGMMLDIAFPAGSNLLVGTRLDYSRAENVDHAGSLDLAASTAADPGVFHADDRRASGRDFAVSWSVSWSHRFPGNIRPYATVSDVGVALDENNNKYENDVIADGHIGRARLVEAGVKASLLDDRLLFTVARYAQARRGARMSPDGAVLAAHASATDTRGWETELKWGPTPDLFFSFYALRQKTRFRPNGAAAVMVDARALGFADVVDAAGNVIYPAEAFLYGGRSFLLLPPDMPEYAVKQGNPQTQLGVLAEYDVREGFGFTVSANYFSSVHSGRLCLVELPSAYVLNVGVLWKQDTWQLQYDVLNVLDERYFRARTGDTLADVLVSAMPGRRWQLAFRAKF